MTNSPIHRLPFDVLTNIFKSLADEYSSNYLGESLIIWDWIVITHVCKYWRVVALDSPRLWVDLCDFRHPGRTEAFLQRSKSANIRVYFLLLKRETKEGIKSLKNALDHADRIIDLRVCTAQEDLWEKIRSALARPSSPLVNLNLSRCFASRYPEENIPPTLPATTPRLRKLSIRFFAIPKDYILPMRLTHLQLKRVTALHSESFLSYLKSCAELEELELDEVDWDMQSTDTSNKMDIPLPCLRKLTVILAPPSWNINNYKIFLKSIRVREDLFWRFHKYSSLNTFIGLSMGQTIRDLARALFGDQ